MYSPQSGSPVWEPVVPLCYLTARESNLRQESRVSKVVEFGVGEDRSVVTVFGVGEDGVNTMLNLLSVGGRSHTDTTLRT